MSLENIMSISAGAMDAQTVRLNLAASNVANADTVDSSPETAFKAKRAVFKTILEDQVHRGGRAYAPARVPHRALRLLPLPV